MRIRTFAALSLVVIALHSHPAVAAYNIKKVGDWEYRAHMCNKVATYVLFFDEMSVETKRTLQDQEMAATAEEFIKSDATTAKPYHFDAEDAKWIAVNVTAVDRAVRQDTEGKPSSALLSERSFNVCLGIFDKFDAKLKESIRN